MKKIFFLALSFTGCLGVAQVIYTSAGTGTAGYSGDGGLAMSAQIQLPCDIAVNAAGSVYIADIWNSRIRRVDRDGTIRTIAGNGTPGWTGDGGLATQASISTPQALAIDGLGNVYFADGYNYIIRKINVSTGIITTVAGTGYMAGNQGGYSGDNGPATSANMGPVTGMCFDENGYLLMACELNNNIRYINFSNGYIYNFAGTPNVAGYSGDGGSATSAKLAAPYDVLSDYNGNVYIADAASYVIRKVSSGIIHTYAGTGTYGHTGNGGQAINATFGYASGLARDYLGNLYVTDDSYYVRKISTSGIVSDFAGNGSNISSGDGGAPLSAGMKPSAVAGDGYDNVHIADANNRIRTINLDGKCPAIAGPNKSNTCGSCCTTTGVVIGTPLVPNMHYAWTCSGTCNLSSTSSAQPTASPCNLVSPTTYTLTVTNTNCVTNTSTMTVTSHPPTVGCCRLMGGSNQFQEPVAFNVFPNPTSGSATVTLYAQAEYLRIFDVSGKMVFEAKDVTESEVKVDVSKYNKGVYFVVAKIGSTFEKQKLVIE